MVPKWSMEAAAQGEGSEDQSRGQAQGQGRRKHPGMRGPLGSHGRQDVARLDHRGAVECPWTVGGDPGPVGRAEGVARKPTSTYGPCSGRRE